MLYHSTHSLLPDTSKASKGLLAVINGVFMSAVWFVSRSRRFSMLQKNAQLFATQIMVATVS